MPRANQTVGQTLRSWPYEPWFLQLHGRPPWPTAAPGDSHRAPCRTEAGLEHLESISEFQFLHSPRCLTLPTGFAGGHRTGHIPFILAIALNSSGRRFSTTAIITAASTAASTNCRAASGSPASAPSERVFSHFKFAFAASCNCSERFSSRSRCRMSRLCSATCSGVVL